jgi:hypothetical protein
MMPPLRYMILLFFLTFGLSGMDIFVLQPALAESADDHSSSEKRQEQVLRHSEARKARPHRKRLALSFKSRIGSQPAARKAQSSLTSLSPPHSGTGNLHPLLQVFRI